jgi:hypothetical protein
MRKLVAATLVALFSFTSVAAGPSTVETPEGFQFAVGLLADETVVHDGPGDTPGVRVPDQDGVLGDPHTCGQEIADRCDKGLLLVEKSGTVTLDLTTLLPDDYGLWVFTSDEDGNLLERIVLAGALYFPVDTGSTIGPGPADHAEFPAKGGQYYAVIVDYAHGTGNYALEFNHIS